MCEQTPKKGWDYWRAPLLDILRVFEVVAIIGGVIFAGKAFHVYESQNKEAVNARIEDMDRAAYMERLKNDKLSSLFAMIDEKSAQEDVKENCDRLLRLSVSKQYWNTIPMWSNISGLCDIVWSEKDYDEQYKYELRSASTHADLILYTVNEAHYAFARGMMDVNIYNTWAAYVTETGGHPLFVLSIYMAHESGYIDNEFAREIQSLMLKNKKTKTVIRAIYPEMENSNWPETVGAQTIAGHKPYRLKTSWF